MELNSDIPAGSINVGEGVSISTGDRSVGSNRSKVRVGCKSSRGIRRISRSSSCSRGERGASSSSFLDGGSSGSDITGDRSGRSSGLGNERGEVVRHNLSCGSDSRVVGHWFGSIENQVDVDLLGTSGGHGHRQGGKALNSECKTHRGKDFLDAETTEAGGGRVLASEAPVAFMASRSLIFHHDCLETSIPDYRAHTKIVYNCQQ